MPLPRFLRFERPNEPLASPRRFAARMSAAIFLWLAIAFVGLMIGMAGYAGFEGMAPVDAFVNAAMILSGMGEFSPVHTAAGKVFVGAFAMLSGLFILIATGVVLAPIFHRILHAFHIRTGKDD